MSNEKNVCSRSWSGLRSTTITLKNPHDKLVTVSDCGNVACNWPFVEDSPIYVPAQESVDVTLNDFPGDDYCYCTDGCPGIQPFDTNPKTVIIT